MRISEIKKCFDDVRCKACIKTLWEEESFRLALEKEKDDPTPENVYFVIRNSFLEMLKAPQTDEQKRKTRKYYKELKTLSKTKESTVSY